MNQHNDSIARDIRELKEIAGRLAGDEGLGAGILVLQAIRMLEREVQG